MTLFKVSRAVLRDQAVLAERIANEVIAAEYASIPANVPKAARDNLVLARASDAYAVLAKAKVFRGLGFQGSIVEEVWLDYGDYYLFFHSRFAGDTSPDSGVASIAPEAGTPKGGRKKQ